MCRLSSGGRPGAPESCRDKQKRLPLDDRQPDVQSLRCAGLLQTDGSLDHAILRPMAISKAAWWARLSGAFSAVSESSSTSCPAPRFHQHKQSNLQFLQLHGHRFSLEPNSLSPFIPPARGTLVPMQNPLQPARPLNGSADVGFFNSAAVPTRLDCERQRRGSPAKKRGCPFRRGSPESPCHFCFIAGVPLSSELAHSKAISRRRACGASWPLPPWSTSSNA